LAVELCRSTVAQRPGQLLTELSGWTPQQYQTWVAAVIDRLLDQAPDQGAKGGRG
jgi:hypothetical protein